MFEIRTVLIDDEINNIELLTLLLKKYCPIIKISGHATTYLSAIELLNSTDAELVFMDIKLDRGTGFDVLKKTTNNKLKIIFVTSFDHYAIAAFKFNSIDYILKPINIENLVLAVNKAYKDIKDKRFTEQEKIERVKGSSRNFIAIPSIEKIEFFKISDILYLKSEGGYTRFNLINNKQVVASKNLGFFEKALDEEIFFRVHHGFLINLNHVVKINKEAAVYCIMTNSETIPISKRKLDAFIKFLNLK